jgi:hypothetical protein
MAWNPLAFVGNKNQQAAQAPAPAPAAAPAAPPANPLDAFNSFFAQPAAAPAPAAPAQIQQMQQPPAPPALPTGFLPSWNPQAVQQKLANANFAASVPQDIMAKLQAGDFSVIGDALNAVGRTVMQTSMQFSHQMGETAAKTAYERGNTELGSKIREYQLGEVKPTNAALQHPSAQPVVKALTQMLAGQDPSLSPQAAVQRAEEYFLAMSQNIQSTATATTQQQQAQTSGLPKGVTDDFAGLIGDTPVFGQQQAAAPVQQQAAPAASQGSSDFSSF